MTAPNPHLASHPFKHELYIAQLAVQKAVIVTRNALASQKSAPFEEHEVISHNKKPDKTLVSLADFAAQAILVEAIHRNFPEDAIVGEEDTSLLEKNPDMADKVWQLVTKSHLDDAESESSVPSPRSKAEALAAIERGGQGYGGPEGRVWMIDPIDGTKGFLTGGQYVVCVALLVDGEEKVAAFGAPRISLENDPPSMSEADADHSSPGVLVSAVRAHGAEIRTLSQGALLAPKPVTPSLLKIDDLTSLKFCENTNTTTPQFADRAAIATQLGASWDPLHIYSTQLRYLALTLGAADVVLRTPLPGDPPAHAWDHTGGVMIFEEAGGKVTDLNGKPLVFTKGRDLTDNFGLVAAPKSVHERVLQGAQQVFERHPKYADIVKKPSSNGEP